jgi:NitT/TauT family transport system ATP-binding protein
VVSLEDVGFSYANGTRVLDGLSLVLRPGITAVIGPSGCGKSSLLKLISGLEQPGSGRVAWRAPEAGRHRCAMVFQADTLLPWATVEENVSLYFKFHRGLRKKSEVQAQARELLSMVGLKGFANAYPRQLSGGMRRRVSFLTGIAASPEVLLLDEPFSSVDEPTRVGIHRDVLDIVRRYEITMVIVTHDLAEAITLADRVVILSSRPASVVKEVAMSFGPTRDVVALRSSEAYQRVYADLWRTLSEAGDLDGGMSRG